MSDTEGVTKSIEEIEGEAVIKLREFIKDDPSLADLNLPEEILYLLIRARRNRPELAIKLLKSLQSFKQQYPELFDNPTPQAIESVLENKMIGFVKRQEDGQGPAVMVFRTANWSPSKTSFDELITAGFLYGLYISRRSIDIQRSGILIIIDMSGFGFSHARQLTYSAVTKMANCIIFGSPCKIIGCILPNSPYVFEKVWGVVQYGVPEYYRKFITVTQQDFTKLHQQVGPDMLPLSLGGTISEEEGWQDDIEDRIRESTDGLEFMNYVTDKF